MKPGVLLTQENADRIGEVKVIQECLHSADLKVCIERTREESWQCIGESAGRTADYLIRKRAELKSAGNKAAAGKSPKEFS